MSEIVLSCSVPTQRHNATVSSFPSSRAAAAAGLFVFPSLLYAREMAVGTAYCGGFPPRLPLQCSVAVFPHDSTVGKCRAVATHGTDDVASASNERARSVWFQLTLNTNDPSQSSFRVLPGPTNPMHSAKTTTIHRLYFLKGFCRRESSRTSREVAPWPRLFMVKSSFSLDLTFVTHRYS